MDISSVLFEVVPGKKDIPEPANVLEFLVKKELGRGKGDEHKYMAKLAAGIFTVVEDGKPRNIFLVAVGYCYESHQDILFAAAEKRGIPKDCLQKVGGMEFSFHKKNLSFYGESYTLGAIHQAFIGRIEALIRKELELIIASFQKYRS